MIERRRFVRFNWFRFSTRFQVAPVSASIARRRYAAERYGIIEAYEAYVACESNSERVAGRGLPVVAHVA